jgi:hypothetical protein
VRRRLLSRKWLALHVLLVVCLVSFSLLGRWQFTRAESVDGTIRNIAYALQWWIFAAFAIFFWWKMLKSDLAEDRGETGTPAPAASAGSGDATGSAGGPASHGSAAGAAMGAAGTGSAGFPGSTAWVLPAASGDGAVVPGADGPGRRADAYAWTSDQILDESDPEDAELIAYNRYLAQLNERHERARSR